MIMPLILIIYRFLRSAIDRYMQSGDRPFLAILSPPIGAYNWATTVVEEDMAGVDSSESENER